VRERTHDDLANHKHTLKAHRQDVIRRDRNRSLRTRLRHALKSIRGAIEQGKTDEATTALSGTVSLIDKMSAKGVIHDNAAARYKSRLAKRLAGAVTAASATPAT
jgi:small subunit ribosomal protein S20